MDNISPIYRENYNLVFDDHEMRVLNKLFNDIGHNDILEAKFRSHIEHSIELKKIYDKTILFLNTVLIEFSERFSLDMKVGNWGYRNEKGRSVEPCGHVHVRDYIYFTSITTILGDGPWFMNNGSRESGYEGETIVFSEEYFLENYPELGLKPVLHGSPNYSTKRLVLLCSFVPKSS